MKMPGYEKTNRKPKHTKELIKTDSNSQLYCRKILKTINLNQNLSSKLFSAIIKWHTREI